MCSTDVLLPDATLSAVQAAVTALAGSRIVLHATDRGWAGTPRTADRPGARRDRLRDRLRGLLLLAQANAFTGVLTGAGDTLDLRHAALCRGGHTHPGGGVLHLTHEALGDLRRHAGRWYGEDGDRRGGSDRYRESTGKD